MISRRGVVLASRVNDVVKCWYVKFAVILGCTENDFSTKRIRYEYKTTLLSIQRYLGSEVFWQPLFLQLIKLNKITKHVMVSTVKFIYVFCSDFVQYRYQTSVWYGVVSHGVQTVVVESYWILNNTYRPTYDISHTCWQN